jgi:hypothetical protein
MDTIRAILARELGGSTIFSCVNFQVRAGGFMKIAMLVWLALMAGAAPAFAQNEELVLAPEFEQKLDELAKWLKDYEAWEKWFELWGNRVQHNFDDQPIYERKKRPEPPVWLEAECQDDLITDGLFANACFILRRWDEHPLLIVQRRSSSFATSGARANDDVPKRSFFQRVHLTGLWMEARYPATPAYGIVGMQVGVFEVGRFTLPAVGVMVVMVPEGDGGLAWKPATTLGFGYWLCDFVPPFMKTRAGLHFNVARTQIHGQGGPVVPTTTSVHLFGLSVSAKRRR